MRTVVADHERKREEDLYSNSIHSKNKEDLLRDSERSQFASTVAEIADEQSRKLLKNEMRLREDAQAKFMSLEKV